MQQLLSKSILHDPFAQKYPEAVDSTLPSSASCIKFNPSGPFAGHYLAAGTTDGVIEIWSIETRGLVRLLEGHVKPVTSVSWSRNNRYLVSASLDSTVIVWDLSVLASDHLHPVTPLTIAQHGESSTRRNRLETIRFDAPVARAEFHPRNSSIVLVTLSVNEVVLVDLRQGASTKAVLEDNDGEGDAIEEDGAEHKRATLACAMFSPCGSRIYAGSTGGELLIFDPPTRSVLHRYKVANSTIRQMAFDSKGNNLMLSSTDRALRVLSVHPLSGLLDPLHRFQDLVNRTPWNSLGFSGDGEYVMGGAGHKEAHNVFIWDTSFGTLVKVLEGPRESLIDCDWHPTRPVIASVATSGDIHLWQTSSPDNWAAFAPGFEELEENVEYDEREDEFDIEDETELSRRKDLEEDLDIDVLTTDDSYPRRPEPVTILPNTMMRVDDATEETDELRAIKIITLAREWADADADDDTWEGFFLSLDLLEKDEEETG